MAQTTIYKVKDLKKDGTPKKIATPDFISQEKSNEVAQALKELGYTGFATPYFFTHIQAVNKDGEEVRIYQKVEVKDGWLTVSPRQLIVDLI